jgi:ectoine hydroxylase
MQLTDKQIEKFEQDGYLFFPNAFSTEEVGVLKQAALDVYALQREEVWREKTGVARTAFAAHTYNDAFRRLGAHPRLIEPVMRLLDGPVYMHQYKVNAKIAFDGDVWQWHQDYGTWARDDLMPEPRAMNIAVFLDDVTGDAGSMLMFSSLLVHASPPNISPMDRTIVYLSLCHVDNHIRQFKRPEWVAHRDFTPIEPLADDTLRELIA